MPRALEHFTVSLKLEKSQRYPWPFSRKGVADYKLPLFRLPNEPVEVELYRVLERQKRVEKHDTVSGKHKNKSGKSNHREGCFHVKSKGQDWEIDLSTARLHRYGADDGHAWIDLAHSTKEAIKVCYNVKPAKKHFEKGYVEYDVLFTQYRMEPERDPESTPFWSSYLTWNGQVRAKVPSDQSATWHLTGTAFWGSGFDYDETNSAMPIIVSDVVKEKGFLLIRMKEPNRIPELAQYGIRQ